MDDNKAQERAEKYDPTGDTTNDPCCCCAILRAEGRIKTACELCKVTIMQRELEQLHAVQKTEPPNEPLTLDELRGMDGEPLYIVEHPDWGHWELSEYAEDYLEDRDPDFYGMTMPPTLPDSMGRYGLHVLGWLAYRRKPDGGGE